MYEWRENGQLEYGEFAINKIVRDFIIKIWYILFNRFLGEIIMLQQQRIMHKN